MFDDIDRIETDKGPKNLVVLAPEEENFMLAIKTCRESGLIEPVLRILCSEEAEFIPPVFFGDGEPIQKSIKGTSHNSGNYEIIDGKDHAKSLFISTNRVKGRELTV